MQRVVKKELGVWTSWTGVKASRLALCEILDGVRLYFVVGVVALDR